MAGATWQKLIDEQRQQRSTEAEEPAWWAKLIGCAVATPFAVAFSWVLFLAQAYVAERIWAWHAVPLGLPAVTWRVFMAASLLRYVMIGWKYPRVEPKDERSAATKAWTFMMYLAAPWLALLFAWWLR